MFSSHASRVLASSSSTTTTTRRGARTTRSFHHHLLMVIRKNSDQHPPQRISVFRESTLGTRFFTEQPARFDPCVALKKVVVSRGQSRSLLFRKKARRCVVSVDKSGEENQSYLFSLHVFRVYHALYIKSFPFKNIFKRDPPLWKGRTKSSPTKSIRLATKQRLLSFATGTTPTDDAAGTGTCPALRSFGAFL